MYTVGDRLKEERERLGLSQAALGETCGVQKRTQINYEKGERAPDALYLAAFDRVGGDVMYVLTGRKTAPALLPPDEAMLLDRYRASPRELRDASLRVLLGGEAPRKKIKQVVKGTANQMAAGNVVNQTQGEVHVGGRSGSKRKR